MTPVRDVVYTWVDGNCPDYQSLCQVYSEQPRDLNPERYRDLELLKYSLRSVEMYAPWLENLHLLTLRPQVPTWLNLEHPNLYLHHHDELCDSPEILPTFNCNVIESFLHRLPIDSEHFLYMNDDFLFGRETELADFLTVDGRIRLLGTLWGERWASRCREKSWLSLGLIEHTPLLIAKRYWEAMLEARPEALQKTRKHRFRQDHDLKMDKLYRIYLAGLAADEVEIVPAYQLLRYHRFQKLTNLLWWQRIQLAFLRWLQPKFYCFNDDLRDNPNPSVMALVRNYLDEAYPRPSRFEI